MTDYDRACSLRALAEQAANPDSYQMASDAFRMLDMPAAAEAMANRARYYEKERPPNWRSVAHVEPCAGGCAYYDDHEGVEFCPECGLYHVKTS